MDYTDYKDNHRFVKYMRVCDSAVAPEYKTPGSAGFDIAVCEDTDIPPAHGTAGGITMARTGLVIQAPDQHMLMIAPRSSTFKRYRLSLANTIGIVDQDFCGPDDELLLALHNHNYFTQYIPAGTRLAQGIFVPVAVATFLESSKPLAASRGGWGSTGA